MASAVSFVFFGEVQSGADLGRWLEAAHENARIQFSAVPTDWYMAALLRGRNEKRTVHLSKMFCTKGQEKFSSSQIGLK